MDDDDTPIFSELMEEWARDADPTSEKEVHVGD